MKNFILILALMVSASTSHALWECNDSAGKYSVLLANSFDLAFVTKVDGRFGAPPVGGQFACDTIEGMPITYPALLAACDEIYVKDGGYSAAVINNGTDLTIDLSTMSIVGKTHLADLVCSIKTS